MYCGNCGTRVEDNASVCPNCNKQFTINPPKAEAPQFIQQPIQAVAAYDNGRSKEKLPTSIVLALAIVSGLFTLFVVLALVVFIFGGSGLGDGLELYCESVPTQTSQDSIILSGTIKGSSRGSNLYLNGEVIETTDKKERKKNWMESVVLESGENTFVVTLSDGNGNSKTTVLNVDKQDDLTYPEGTILNLSTTGVYVRPTPNKSDKFVVMLWDMSTDLVCLGEESTDAEGYLWCKVNTPSNGAGWIRTDLVKVKY